MDRISTDSKSVDLHGAGKHGFKDPGVPGIGGTIVDEAFFNGVQEEILAVVEASGQTPSGSDLHQLLNTMRFALLHQAVCQAGTVIEDVDSAFAADICQAGAMTPNGRMFFVGNTKRVTYCDAPYVKMYAPTSALGGFDYMAVCHYGVDNAVVIVGEDEEIITITTTSETVTERNTGGTKILRSVAYSPTLAQLCTVGDDGTILTASVSDLDTWTPRTAGSSYAGDLNAVLWDSINDQWVIGGDDREIQTSDDGITWGRRNTGAGANVRYLALGSTRLIAEVDGAGPYLASADGLTWSAAAAAENAIRHYANGCLFGGGSIMMRATFDDGVTSLSKPSFGPGVFAATPLVLFGVEYAGGASTLYRLGTVGSL